MTVATIAAVVGVGSAGLGIYNGIQGMRNSGGAGGSVPVYQPQGLGATDTQWQQNNQQMNDYIRLLTSQAGYTLPAAYANLINLDTSGLKNYGNLAGGADVNAAQLANSNMGSMVNLAGGQNALANYINDQGMSLWNTAQDPQGALRAKLMQGVQDTSRANASAAGLGTSGAGVGTVNQSMNDFALNWENAQLQRQLAGMGGLNQALGTGQRFQDNVAQDLAAAQQYASAAPGYFKAAGLDPFQMAQMQAYWPMQATNLYGQAVQSNIVNPNLGAMGAAIPYMNYGQGAQQNAFMQNQTGLNNLTSGLTQLSNPSIWSQLSQAFATPQSSGSGNNSGYSTDWANQYGYTPGY